MIVYKIDVLDSLKEAGYNPKKMREGKLLGENAIQRLRDGQMVGIDSINRICKMLDMQPGNIIKYVEDPEPEGKKK